MSCDFIEVKTYEQLEIANECESLIQEVVRLEIVEVAIQGPPGPPGPAGGSSVQRQAGTTVSALLVVYENANVVWPLDYQDEQNIFEILGVSLTAADAGQNLNIQRSGVINDNSWNWQVGRVYLGANGTLTQTPKEDGFSVLIGTAVSPNRLLLNIQDPIDME